MIRQIRGTVLSVDVGGAVVDVSGWGVYVYLPSPESLAVGQEAVIETHLAIKQDGIELYGFTDSADRRFFGQLLTVSGIGPKTALSIMRRGPREQLEAAIGKRDISYLTRIAGLGKKAAEKLAVELSEKIGAVEGAGDGEDGEILDTLIALGYTEREARKAVSGIPNSIVGRDARLKAALSAKS